MTNPVSNNIHDSYRIRYPLKVRNLIVQSIEDISPSMRRIILTGDDLNDFISSSFDDHCKVFFPDPVTGKLQLPNLSESGLKDGVRLEMRDYTPRMYDNQKKTLALDFVRHQAGIATQWASQAKVGDKLGIGGPKGSMIIPMNFDGYVMIGDETALPAIARRLEELPSDKKTLVIIEIESEEHRIPLNLSHNTRIIWLYRHDKPAGDAQLFLQALSDVSVQSAMITGDVHIWVATETSVVRKIRDFLYTLPAINVNYIKATGYWQHE